MLFVFVVHSGVKHVLIIRVTWRVSFERQELLALLEHKSSPPGFFFWRLYLGEPVLLIFFFFFVLAYCVSLNSGFRVVMSATMSAYKRYPFRLYPQLFVGGVTSCKRYLCLSAHSGFQHILYCVFVCLRLVYPMLPVSLDCPLLIVPSVFSNVYSVRDKNKC